MCVFVCVCVCVCDECIIERERESKRASKRASERARERERESLCVHMLNIQRERSGMRLAVNAISSQYDKIRSLA